jgi:replicative DNA helicase
MVVARGGRSFDKKTMTELDEIVSQTPSGSPYEIIRVMRESAYRKKVMAECREIFNRSKNSDNISEIDHMIANLQACGDTSVSGRPRSIMSPSQVSSLYISDIESEIRGSKPTNVCTSGVDKVDLRERNFEGHRLIVFMAESGIGKTRFAAQVVSATNELYEHLDNDLGIAVFIHESGVKSWLKLLLSKMGGIPSGYLKSGSWDALKQHGYEDSYNEAVSRFKSSRIYLTDSVSNISSLERNIDRFEALHNRRPGVIVIDYIQLLGGDPALGEVRQLEDISWRLQRIADEHECQVWALSQLTAIPGGGATPKWSRAIKENATLVLRLKDAPELGIGGRLLYNEKNRVNARWTSPIKLNTDLSTCTYTEKEDTVNSWV